MGHSRATAHAVQEQEIRDFCKGQIAHFKVPRYVRIVEQFPLTATGKPQKFEMRKAMIEQLGPAYRAHRVTARGAGSRAPARGHSSTTRGK